MTYRIIAACLAALVLVVSSPARRVSSQAVDPANTAYTFNVPIKLTNLKKYFDGTGPSNRHPEALVATVICAVSAQLNAQIAWAANGSDRVVLGPNENSTLIKLQSSDAIAQTVTIVVNGPADARSWACGMLMGAQSPATLNAVNQPGIPHPFDDASLKWQVTGVFN